MPAENLLGEIGKGHKVAFNVLNYGRFKLAAMCAGGVKYVIGESAKYASTRRQFNTPIAEFGAIRHKLGDMTARAYALEAAIYSQDVTDAAIVAYVDDDMVDLTYPLTRDARVRIVSCWVVNVT